MIQDTNGKMSLARTAYITTLTVTLVKILVSGVVFGDIVMGVADISGMALLVAATGATYFGRENSKKAVPNV